MNQIILEGEYFDGNFLPPGVVVKNATGIGATHHELFTAQRNSIVLSPYLSILQSKRDPSILTVHSETLKNNAAAILHYFRHHPGYKKVHVTIESFIPLEKLLKRHGVSLSSDFHLLLDEVHVAQTDADYRPLISQSFDIYKRFPADRRTCLSATVYPFSDPLLQGEPVTFLIKKQDRKEVECYATDDPINLLGSLLMNSDGQIHVYVTSMNFILRVIKDNKLPDVSIYCGKGSMLKAGQWYKEYDGYPQSKVNFYTSHALTGCDNYATGIQIIVSGQSHGQKYTLLLAQLFQAFGRHRNGVSKTIVIHTHNHGKLKRPKDIRPGLISKAITQIVQLNRRLSSTKRRKANIFFAKNIIKGSRDIVRFDINKSLCINFPIIDRVFIEQRDNFIMHGGEESMKTILDKKFKVTFYRKYFNGVIAPFPTVGRRPKQAVVQSALQSIERYEFSLDRLNDTSEFTFDEDKFRKEIVYMANSSERKYLEAYMKIADVDLYKGLNGDLDGLRALQVRRALEHDDEVIQILNSELPSGRRIKTKDLIPTVQKLFSVLGWDDMNITHRNVKKQLKYFRTYKDCKISKTRDSGVEIVG